LICRIKVITRLTASEGLVWANVAEDVIADRNVGKVHDHVGSLGQTHQQTASVISRQVYRRRKETTLVSNLPHFNSGDVAEVQNQESRLATVQKA
jgi:1,2-phenylacetyl-CoA epoxidase PaaB subunit